MHKQSVITFAGLSIWLQAVSSGAGAQVAALCVFTQEVAGFRRQRALIHICNIHKVRWAWRNIRGEAKLDVWRLTPKIQDIWLSLSFFFYHKTLPPNWETMWETKAAGQRSAIPTQVVAVKSALYPTLQWQRKDPMLLMHWPLWQRSGNTWHSLMSEKNRYF